MGLFGGGALKRKVAALTQALEVAESKVSELTSKCEKLESDLSTKDESFRIAKEGRQKAEKKLERLAAKSISSDKKLSDMVAELTKVKADLSEYRDTVLSARAESDLLKAKLARHTAPPAAISPEPADAPVSEEVPPEVEARRADRRVARLEEQLANERAQKDEIKARALRAEQAIRDAGKKRASDAGKLDAKFRETEHALQSERKAYKILQLQYEALLEEHRGSEQQKALGDANTSDASNTAVAAEQNAPEDESVLDAKSAEAEENTPEETQDSASVENASSDEPVEVQTSIETPDSATAEKEDQLPPEDAK